MKDLGYSEGYRYAHDFEDNFVQDNFLPDQITGTVFYEPGRNARELEIRKQLEARWQKIYGYKKNNE